MRPGVPIGMKGSKQQEKMYMTATENKEDNTEKHSTSFPLSTRGEMH